MLPVLLAADYGERVGSHFAGQPVGELVDDVADTSMGKMLSEILEQRDRVQRAK